MTRIDLSVVNDYVAANGKSVVYAKGERIVQQGRLCRYVGVVQSGYFKYVALNSKGQEVVTGFSFEGEVVTDYVQGFLFDQPSLTSIVAGCLVFGYYGNSCITITLLCRKALYRCRGWRLHSLSHTRFNNVRPTL